MAKTHFNPQEVRQKIRKIYEDAKKKGEFIYPAKARAMALSMLSKK